MLTFKASLDKECDIVQNVVREGMLDELFDWIKTKGWFKLKMFKPWMLPNNLIQKLKKSNRKQGIVLVKKYLKDKYDAKEILSKSEYIEVMWKKVEKRIIDYLNNLFGFELRYKNYSVYYSHYQPFARSTGKTTIIIPNKLVPTMSKESFIDLITHELIHKYLHQFYQRNKKRLQMSESCFQDEVGELIAPIIEYWTSLSKLMSGDYKFQLERFKDLIKKEGLKSKFKKMKLEEFMIYVSRLIKK